MQLPNLGKYSSLLTPKQRNDLAKAYKFGNDMIFKINQRQVANGIGTLIASIGIPMLLNALTGKGVGRGGPRLGRGGPRMGPPPFIGTWIRGKKKRSKEEVYY